MKLIFDGGNHGRTSLEGYGSFKIDDYPIERRTFGIGYTNNAAEYITLYTALQHIIDTYGENGNAFNIDLEIYGDSMLLKEQIGIPDNIKGWQAWKMKAAHLRPLRNKCRALLLQFRSFTYHHVPRTEIVKVLGH